MRNSLKLLPLFALIIFGCSSDDNNSEPETLFWEKVSVGGSHTIAIRSDGTLWTWGTNNYGQLGDGTTTNRLSPVQIGTDSDWEAIGAGQYYSVAVKDNGHLFSWGINEYGQIGNGTYTNQLSPLQIGTDTWAKISIAQANTLALRSDGTIWAWGNNEEGQIGDGSGDDYVPAPVQIGTANNWVDVIAGTYHAFAKRANGDLFGWGGYSCSLGNGQDEPYYTPQLITTGGTVSWQTLSAETHTLGLKSNGKLFVAGINTFGALGNPSVDEWVCEFEQLENSTWTMVDAGIFGSAGIKSDGSLWVWGYNHLLGQLGFVDEENRYVPTQLGTETNWKFVDIGGWYNVALTTDNILWSWGLLPTMETGTATGPVAPYIIPCPQ
jgi:alpha-tubulin suppressor-like RCC1 family protein